MKMKNKLFAVSLLAIMVMMLVPLSGVMATEKTPPLTISESAAVWTIDLNHPVKPTDYIGKDVVDVSIFVATLIENPDYDPNDPNSPPYIAVWDELDIAKLSICTYQIKIWPDVEDPDFPETGEALETYVDIKFTDNAVLTFNGPGFAYRWG